VFRSDIQIRKTKGSPLHISLFAKSRFNKLVEYIFAFILIVLLMGPVYILYYIRHINGCVQNTAALAFTGAFALLCATATTAKRHEIFAVTAG
jgi:hypothetical protein